jgi:tetratricopeptide (TPR) repeat protein
LTEVQVSEGRVWIHTPSGVQELAANQSWRSAPDVSPAALERAIEPPPVAVEPAPKKPAAARSSEPAAATALRASELSEQNRLLEAAGLARENGMPELALERLERLLESHPEAELAHNARVERFRLLAQLGRREAARGAAREYLERHPNGFARKEARLLLDASSGEQK